MTEAALLADIGGTNARFAVQSAGRTGPIESLAVADFASTEDAVAAFLDRSRETASPRSAFLGVAAPVNGGRCSITNSHWVIDGDRLRQRFGFRSVELLNDFEAVALALPHLQAPDLRPLGGGDVRADGPMVVLGPGTGFGIAGLARHGGRMVPVASEGGHVTLPAGNPREDAVIDLLRRQFGHVSVERAVSGPGLENLYRAIATLDVTGAPPRNAREITDAALAGACATSRAALDLFCALLGSVAGNLALTFKARGGVFIAGGIAPRIADDLSRSAFRERFEAKGRFRGYLEPIATNIIMIPDAAFRGLADLAERSQG